MNIFNKKSIEKLFEAILLLKTKEDCMKFFEDVCTVKELQDMSQRLDVAWQLKEGKAIRRFQKTQVQAPQQSAELTDVLCTVTADIMKS